MLVLELVEVEVELDVDVVDVLVDVLVVVELEVLVELKFLPNQLFPLYIYKPFCPVSQNSSPVVGSEGAASCALILPVIPVMCVCAISYPYYISPTQ